MCAFRSILTCIHPLDNRSRGELYIFHSTHRSSNERTHKCACYHVLETINFIPVFGSSFMCAAAIAASTCSSSRTNWTAANKKRSMLKGRCRMPNMFSDFHVNTAHSHVGPICVTWTSAYVEFLFKNSLLLYAYKANYSLWKFACFVFFRNSLLFFSLLLFFRSYTLVGTRNFSSFARDRIKLICMFDTNEHNCVLYRVVESEANRSAHASINYCQWRCTLLCMCVLKCYWLVVEHMDLRGKRVSNPNNSIQNKINRSTWPLHSVLVLNSIQTAISDCLAGFSCFSHIEFDNN